MMGEAIKRRHSVILGGIIGFSVLALLSTGVPSMAYAADDQNHYTTPEKAVDALVFASRHNHTSQLIKILGADSEKLVNSGDDVADQEGRARFVAAYDKSHTIESRGEEKILTVGDEGWPVPIPLVHDDNGWRFDTAAGQDEILNRRIGRNELNVIEVCRAYVDAQREYAIQHMRADGSHEYAQKFTSSEGTHDGLFWSVKQGEQESPLGPLIASAAAEGYSDKSALSQHEPYHGYFYKILKAQGSNAAGGALDYVKDGHMTGGFAMIAFPANYGDTGVMSFIVNENGIVYQKNLGPDTIDIASAITTYDPDSDWKVVQ